MSRCNKIVEITENMYKMYKNAVWNMMVYLRCTMVPVIRKHTARGFNVLAERLSKIKMQYTVKFASGASSLKYITLKKHFKTDYLEILWNQVRHQHY